MNKIFYFCDRKKCERCNRSCLHTSDPEHALSKNQWPYGMDASGDFVQMVNAVYDYEVVGALNVTADNRTGENV